MSKKALVVGINDYCNWNGGVTVGGLTFPLPTCNGALAIRIRLRIY